MNRVIKFRAFVETHSGKEMVDNWCYLNLTDNHFYAVDITNERPDIGKVFSVMQFTGLHDKNGKEIYEGDICISKYGTKKPVQICFGEFENILDSDDDKSTNIGFYFTESTGEVTPLGKCTNGTTDYLEVIGNIHQNPELL